MSGAVRMEGTSSSNRMIGGGLKKCIPMTRSGRLVTMARSTIGSEEVLEARTTSGRVSSSSRRNRPSFVSMSSVAASRTRSASDTSSRSVVAVIRPSTSSRSPGSSFPRSTARPMDRSMAAGPRATRSSSVSTNTVSTPVRATTSVMPEPMIPAPMIPTFRTSLGSIVPPDLHGSRRQA